MNFPHIKSIKINRNSNAGLLVYIAELVVRSGREEYKRIYENASLVKLLAKVVWFVGEVGAT